VRKPGEIYPGILHALQSNKALEYKLRDVNDIKKICKNANTSCIRNRLIVKENGVLYNKGKIIIFGCKQDGWHNHHIAFSFEQNGFWDILSCLIRALLKIA